MKDVRVLLQSLCREEGITVFVSSHLLAEVEQLCTRVGILEKGRLVAEGSVKELLAGVSVGVTEVDVRARNRERLLEVLPQVRGASVRPLDSADVRIRLDALDVPALNAGARRARRRDRGAGARGGIARRALPAPHDEGDHVIPRHFPRMVAAELRVVFGRALGAPRPRPWRSWSACSRSG
jgi:ABC-2 type transport system ATP-binding protein